MKLATGNKNVVGGTQQIRQLAIPQQLITQRKTAPQKVAHVTQVGRIYLAQRQKISFMIKKLFLKFILLPFILVCSQA